MIGVQVVLVLYILEADMAVYSYRCVLGGDESAP